MFDLYTYCPWCSTLTIYGLVVTVYWLLFDCLWSLPRKHTSREEKNKKDEVPPRFELGSLDSHLQRLRGSRSGRRKFSSTGGRAPGRDPVNQNSNRSDRKKWSTSKGGPVFSKLFRLDRTDPMNFGLKFPGNFCGMDAASWVPTLTRPFQNG